MRRGCKMTEEIKDIAEQEVNEPEVVEEVLDSAQEVEQEVASPEVEEQQVEAQPVVATEKAENLKALRESRKQLKNERDEYLRRIQTLEAAQAKKDEELDYSDDDYSDPNGSEIKKLKQGMANMAMSNSRMKLQTQFPDFSKVVTEESISILKQRFPEIADTLDQSRDIYTTGASAYNIIKKFGLHVDDEYVAKKENVTNNMKKPRPVSSLKSSSALAHASDYSDLSDKKVRDEIIRIATERANG